MSVEYSFFAEHLVDRAWTSIGEACYSNWHGERVLRPPCALEIDDNELITVLCGERPRRAGGLAYAGLKTIALPRGLPDNLSPLLRRWAELFLGAELGYCPSWLLSREILDFDWVTPNILHRGYVMAKMADLFDLDPTHTFPESMWPGGWYEEMPSAWALERRRQEPSFQEDRFVYPWPREGTVEVNWTESHLDVIGNQDEFFADLRALGPPDTVRLVFWIE